MIEHHIQREIIDRLMRADTLRFSDLKPDGMESNIFMYHLKQLMKDGYVEKDGTAYRLAAKGLTYVDSLSSQNKRPRLQPKLITILALYDREGRWLLAERKVQPYLGTRMFPSGKQHRGETGAEHVVRELREKTGWSEVALTFRGVADIQITDATGTLLTHVVARVYAGETEAATPPESDRFRYVWHDFNSDATPLMPGTAELYEYLAKPEPFMIEISTQQG